MKLIAHFDDFLKNHVNLNQSRINILEQRMSTISKYLKDNELFGSHYVKMEEQGSWAHKTIIRPSSKKNEFDADILFYLDEFDEWEPKDYVNKLYSEFRQSEVYKNIVTRGTRCVTLDYSDEFHLDIVPAFTQTYTVYKDEDYITNRIENEEERTNPDGYTKWFRDKNKYTSNNHLIKVVRLAKYMRDTKGNFSVKSILLNTLLGDQVDDALLFGDDPGENFPDVPTSFKTIFNRLDDFLQENEIMPEIENPSLPGETFTRHWDEDKYQNFRDKIHLYTEKTNDAYDEPDKIESAKKWQLVFGEEFASTLTKVAKSTALSTPSHCKYPRWPIDIVGKVGIDAYLYSNSRRLRLGGLNNNGRQLSKNLDLRFVARTDIPEPYDISWQVVNTGAEAAAVNDLRGGFHDDSSPHWERTQYRGKHWIECFIIKSGKCLARSGRFFISVN